MAFDFSLKEYLDVKVPLRFRPDGGFKILLLTDFHGGKGMHPQLKPGIDALVKHSSPDLVLIGGDMNGPHIGCSNITELREYLVEVTEAMESAGIPWAHVYGNHDYNKGISNEDQQKVYEEFPFCITKRGPADIHGVGNYVLPLLHSDSDDVAMNIWGLDSHDDNREFAKAYDLPEDTRFILPNHFCMGEGNDTVHFDQIMWYFETSKAIEKTLGKKIPSIMYMHIPIPEYCLIPRNPVECGMTGKMGESVCCSELNSGLFSSCLQRGDVKAIFCGHEHLNDFSGEYCGIRLSYSAAVCYDVCIPDDIRGGRVIELSEKEPENIVTYTLKHREVMGSSADRI